LHEIQHLKNRPGIRNDLSGFVSVIIVNWNGKKLLQDCLRALMRQTYRAFTVIVVDNGSRDGSVEFVNSHFPGVRTIALSDNTGFSAANNVALKLVQTPYVALLNNDTAPDSFWIERLVDALDNCPAAGFAASKMLFYDRPDLIDRGGDGYSDAGVAFLRGRNKKSDEFDKLEPVFGACAGAALYRTALFDAVGLFDEDFFLVHEDVDLSFRAQLQGYRCLYVPEAIVYHRASSSLVYDSSTTVYYGHRNLEWVYIKNMPVRLMVKTIFFHLIYDAAAFFFFSARGLCIDFIRAKIDSAKGLKKMLQKRKKIQKKRTVSDNYIWGIMGRERMLQRLTHRLKK